MTVHEASPETAPGRADGAPGPTAAAPGLGWPLPPAAGPSTGLGWPADSEDERTATHEGQA